MGHQGGSVSPLWSVVIGHFRYFTAMIWKWSQPRS